MFFTKEDILKIQKGLADAGIKDSQMEEAIYLKNNDTISIVQNGINKKINVLDFINQLDDLRQDNFINLSDRYDEYYISLSDAIKLIPEQKRNEGLVITFQGENGDWKMYQFKGDLTQFNHEEAWDDLYDFSEYVVNSILPDEEDITKVPTGEKGNYVTKFKDKEYDPENFSGMATKILRKRIIEVDDHELGKVKKNLLLQEDFDQENCIYKIKYDFDLNGQEITIPEGCILNFQGGAFYNGIINCLNTRIENISNCKILDNVKFKGTLLNDKIYVNWFGARGNNLQDSTKEIQSCFNSIIELDSNAVAGKSFVFTDNNYIISDTIHVYRQLSYCAVIGSLPTSLDSSITITSNNNNAPMFRFYTVGSTVHNLAFKYATDLEDSEDKICLMFKSTDNLDTDNYSYSDVDASIYDCAFMQCTLGINYWGVQMDCHDNRFTLNSTASIKIDCFPKAYREYLGPARCYRIHRNNFHANPYRSILIWNNTGELGYNFHITDNFSDTFSLLFKGNLKYSIIANNNLSIITAGAVIDSGLIESTTINSNFFNKKSDYPYGSLPNNYIKADSVSRSVISGNYFGDCVNTALFFKQSTAVTITNNIIGRTQGGKEVNDQTGESLDFNSMIILSYDKESSDVVISNNVIKYLTVDNIITYYGYFTNKIKVFDNIYNKYIAQASFENEVLNLRYKSYPQRYYVVPKYLKTNSDILTAFDFTVPSNKLESGIYAVNASTCTGFVYGSGYFRMLVISDESSTETRLVFPIRWQGRGIYIQKLDGSSITTWMKLSNVDLEGYTESSEGEFIQAGDVGTTDAKGAIILRTPNNTWVRADGSPIKVYGTSSERPSTTKLGTVYYDTDLGMPIFKSRQNTNVWCTAYGYSADYNIKGSTAERPTISSSSVGFQYFDTTINKPIWWTGSNWIDATGENV